MKAGPRVAALLLMTVACGGDISDPCTSPKPILQISAAQAIPTGARIPSVAISNVNLNGVPMDTADLRLRSFSLQRGPLGFDCTTPCSFGYEPGTYTFDAYARGFYRTSLQAAASYSDSPAGCPAAHGSPTSMAVALIEFDSARVSFRFSTANATGLGSSAIAQVTFDDGSGPQTVDLTFPWPTFQTRNSGNLHVRIVVGHPDTIAVGEMDFQLKKDWRWSVDGHLSTGDALAGNFCSSVRSFPLHRPIPGADSLRITFRGDPISWTVIC